MSKPEYSQGITGSGPAVLKNGVPMTIEDIVSELNYYVFLEGQAQRTINNVLRSCEIWHGAALEYSQK